MHQLPEEPIIPLNQGSLRAIDSAIIGHLATLKARRPAPSTAIQKFQTIRLKLAPFLRPDGFPEGTVLPLSQNEFQLIEEAIRGFKGKIRHTIPPSSKRDATLQELERLHQYILYSLIQGMP